MAALLLFGLHGARAFAHEPGATGCAAFSWDVAGLLEVMRAPAAAVRASAAVPDPAVPLLPSRHYSVALPPQSGVRFAVPPARPARDADPRGGSLRLAIDRAGRYRIALSGGHWLDVVVEGVALESLGHQGAKDCAPVHKIVEFELPAGRPLTLQISGRAQPVVELAIVPVSASRD